MQSPCLLSNVIIRYRAFLFRIEYSNELSADVSLDVALYCNKLHALAAVGA